MQHSFTGADCLKRTVNQTPEWVIVSTWLARSVSVSDWSWLGKRCILEMVEVKQEGEPTGAYRLLETLYRQYHLQIDVLVADALHASRVFFEAVLKHRWHAVIVSRTSNGSPF